jgi:hypothetical protein
LRNRIEELENQLQEFQSDYADLMQMDQADREATLEAIKLKYLREKNILVDREETIQALQECVSYFFYSADNFSKEVKVNER